MTESYDPYANAIAERVNGILKHDFLLDRYKTNQQGMKHLVKEIIYIYNTQRPHLSPVSLSSDSSPGEAAVREKSTASVERMSSSEAVLPV